MRLDFFRSCGFPVALTCLSSCTATAPRDESLRATTSSVVAGVPDTRPGWFFGKGDERLLERYGVTFVPGGEGPLFDHSAPVDALCFREGGSRHLTEEEFVAVFPAIQRMDPRRLDINVPVTDRSVELVNRLRSVRTVLVGSDVTMDGLRRLRLRPGVTLVVERRITEPERRELEGLMPGVMIRVAGERGSVGSGGAVGRAHPTGVLKMGAYLM